MLKGGHLVAAIDVATSEREIAVALMDDRKAIAGVVAAGFYAMRNVENTQEVHFRGVTERFIEDYERYDRSRDPLVGWVAKHHAVGVRKVVDLRKESSEYDRLLREHEMTAFADLMIAPIVVAGALSGMMIFVSGDRASFSSEVVARASALSLHVSTRIAVLRSLDSLTLIWDGALTAREHEVAMIAARGLSTAQIAQTAGVSANTIKKHLKQVYEKLDIHSRAELGMRLLQGPHAHARKALHLPRSRRMDGGGIAFSYSPNATR